MFSQSIQTLLMYPDAFGILFRPRIVRYVWISGIISLIAGLVMLGFITYEAWDAVLDVIAIIRESNAGFWANLIAILKNLLLPVLLILVVFSIYKNIALIIIGPVMTKLTGEVEHQLTGREEDLSGSLAKSMGRAVWVALWSTLRELAFTLPCLLLNLIPVIGNIASFIAIFLVQSYYAGINYTDFILERRGLNAQQSIEWVRSRKGEMIGIGAGFLLLLLIPIAGIVLSPATAVVVATMVFVKSEK